MLNINGKGTKSYVLNKKSEDERGKGKGWDKISSKAVFNLQIILCAPWEGDMQRDNKSHLLSGNDRG